MSTAPHLFPPDLHAPVLSGEEFVRAQFDASRQLSGAQRLGWALIEDAFLARRHALRNPHNRQSQRQMQRDMDWMFNGAVARIEFEDLMTMLGLPSDLVRERYLKVTGKVKHKVSTFG
jgi:hypothetical protein